MLRDSNVLRWLLMYCKHVLVLATDVVTTTSLKLRCGSCVCKSLFLVLITQASQAGNIYLLATRHMYRLKCCGLLH